MNLSTEKLLADARLLVGRLKVCCLFESYHKLLSSHWKTIVGYTKTGVGNICQSKSHLEQVCRFQ